jgi:hypothetical protein
MFKKGEINNPKGRPVGSKDQKWKSIQAMWDLFMAEYDQLTPNQRAHYAFETVKMHFERAIAQLPKEQEDSVLSAQKMLDVLKDLEAKNDRRSTGNPSSVADRPSTVQTEPTAKGS